MSTRRLEMSIKALREKAAEQLVEINRGREALKGLVGRARGKEPGAFRTGGQGRSACGSAKKSCSGCRTSSRETERRLEKRALELEKLEHMYDDASFSSSSRQIELVARESELREACQRHRGAARPAQGGGQAQPGNRGRKQGRARCAEGGEEKSRRARQEGRAAAGDACRPRGKARPAREGVGAASRTPRRPRRRRRCAWSASGGDGGSSEDPDKAIAKLDSDRERLEARLTVLARENKRLKAELGALAASGPQ